MLFSIILVSLVPFLTYASEEKEYFEAIQNAVDSVKSGDRLYLADKACYPDIGCFTTSGLMKHIGILPSSPTKINTKFFAYTHDSPKTPKEVNPHDPKTYGMIAADKPLAIIAHGFNNNGQTPQLLQIKDSLIAFASVPTVIVVDWAKGAAAPWYTEAATNTEVVGRQIAFLVETLRTKQKIDPKNVHLLGFSLGAQVSGFAGKWAQSEYKWKVGRISGEF